MKKKIRNRIRTIRPETLYILLQVALLALVMVLIFSAAGCTTVQPIAEAKDSIHTKYIHDSIYIYKHDSVFIDRWRQGDTVYITTEKWRTQWKDKIVEVHDTINNATTNEVIVEVVPEYYKSTSKGFWVLLAIIVLIVVWKVAKVYFSIKSGGLFRS